MNPRQYLLSVLLLLGWSLSSQTLERFPAAFTVDGQLLLNPLSGGLNVPQLSAADLNNDGLQDLYIFERTGNLHLPFLNTGAPGAPQYTFAPDLIANFPACVNWVLLRDYNGDGAMDLFTHFSTPIQGIKVFTGSFNADDELVFEPYQFCCEDYNIIFFPTGGGFQTQLYVSPVDYPAIDDVDGDGDLDILTFSIGGGYVEYYRNQSLEMGYGLDSLIFKRDDLCWGKFLETSFSEEIILSDSPFSCAMNFTDPTADDRHPGSTLVVFDDDNDGDLEVVLGDVNFGKMNYLKNGGDAEDAYMTGQDATYPSYDVPVEIPNFPAGFYLDLDQDGHKDFVATPNDLGLTPNYEVIWFYRNLTNNEFPEFELQQRDWLVDGMLDFGSGANPAFLDVNADGLLDLLVGTEGYFDPGATYGRDPRLILFLNVGSVNAPAFELTDDDYLEFSQFGNLTINFAPATGDLDGDGDKDLLVGEQDGTLFFVENKGGAGNPVQWGAIQAQWNDIDVGQNSHPFIVDLDRDGRKDLLIGERNGNINFFPNIGTPTEPAFEPDETADPNLAALGLITTLLSTNQPAGNSAPWVYDTEDGYIILTGSDTGHLQEFTVEESDLASTFEKTNPNYGNTREGRRTAIALADLNQDGLLEMAVGNLRGGLSFFGTNLEDFPAVGTRERRNEIHFSLSPNPAEGSVWVQLTDEVTRVEVQLVNALGQTLLRQTLASGGGWLSTDQLPAGMYWVALSKEGRMRGVRKLVIK